ncbi:hypothetical protein 1 [Hubei rhabdo-like virus 1]|uniref:hypothetical protein 1 n=1 Tax=Hubei rhabdo-like virus 1 TaxID=1923185 RepID=UPI00090B787A|nr:hypothetical protein 1 [Hubei rhabdo-like virus 1]APG78706.1 hypothetical protein 1 [Hubei rhabdo-like virus 1]
MANANIARFNRIREKADAAGVPGMIPKATAARTGKWSDEGLKKMAESNPFPETARSLGMRKAVLTRFFAFYRSGKIDTGDNCVATVVDALTLLGTGDEQAFLDEDFGPKSFYPPNTSANPTIPATGGSKIKVDTTGLDPQRVAAYNELIRKFPDGSETRFWKFVTTAIESFDGTSITTEGRQVTHLAGFLAATLCRAAVKNKAQLGNAFLKEAYGKNLTALVQFPVEHDFDPPSEETLEKCCSALAKGMGVTDKIFIRLVNRYTQSNSAIPVPSAMVALLSASVLTHTARNGLGMVQMMDQVCLLLQVNWQQLMDLTSMSTTIAAWDVLGSFMTEFYSRANMQYSHNWARIIGDGYLRGLTPKEYPFLGILFLGVLEEFQGPGVWESKWSQNPKTTCSGALDFSKLLVEHCRSSLDKLEGYGGALEILQKNKQGPGTSRPANGVVQAARNVF